MRGIKWDNEVVRTYKRQTEHLAKLLLQIGEKGRESYCRSGGGGPVARALGYGGSDGG